MKIDISTMTDAVKSRGPIAQGAHLVAVSQADYGLSKSGNEMVTVRFEVIGPDDPDRGRELRNWYVLTESMVGRYVALARAIDPQMRPHDPCVQDDLNELIWGKPLVVTVEHEDGEYNGTPIIRERVKSHTGLSDAEVTALAGEYGDGLVPELPDASAF